ncbi:hypothetical protein TRVL_00616 [Trypanosoma vivax]|nr:hypothetical protein TRVL_00616 [Trypanosoma vivax]
MSFVCALTCIAVVARLVLCATANSSNLMCDSDVACFPWDEKEDKACVRAKRINLRFMLDTADQSKSYAVYAFCPVVNELELFVLRGGPAIVALTDHNKASGVLPEKLTNKYLSVYGFGGLESKLFPKRGVSAGAVVAAVDGSSLCGTSPSVAIANTLRLNIGVKKGLFNYEVETSGNESNTTSNHTEGVEPPMVGFSPTCDEQDRCIFDASSVCIGSQPGKKNCASCHTSSSSVLDAQLRVWVSYHGTDRDGYPMLSGGSDPLMYRRFAGLQFFSSIRNLFGGVVKGASGVSTTNASAD